MKKLPDKWKRHPLVRDGEYRRRTTMSFSLAANAAFGLFKLAAGWICASPWLAAIGAYYLALAAMRLILLRSGEESPRARKTAGALMILLALTVSGLTVQMIRDGQAYDYPGVWIYAVAAWAFYSLSAAIAALIRRRQEHSRRDRAIRYLALAGAMMAVFALQTALLARFGQGAEDFAMLMNALTGAVVFLGMTAMGVAMLKSGPSAANRRSSARAPQ